MMWGFVLTSLVAGGVFSFIRPAADIFLAGCSQTVPTFYLILTTLTFRNAIPQRVLGLVVFGLLGNAPLIFVYPWFVQQSGLPLGTVNFLLHCNLAMSWGLQGWGLTELCKRLEEGRGLDRSGAVATSDPRKRRTSDVAAPAH